MNTSYDLIIIGGGITGAGILREAAYAGLKALLVEQRDFAWGTSSRSSKLVHGGMRYLKQGKFGLTRESVLERQKLLLESQDLVLNLPFLVPTYKGMKPGAGAFGAGILIYNTISGVWRRMHYNAAETLLMRPNLEEEGLTGGLRYADARADDARLVLRLIFESRARGAEVLNHTKALPPERGDGLWRVPLEGACRQTVTAPVVVNATGIWVNGQRHTGQAPLRPLRGIHLVFPAWRIPTQQAVALIHPRDNRPVYLLPWEGTTLFGTTDVDHHQDLSEEPRATEDEIAYLMEVLQARLPSLELGYDDIISCFAGVRPVISTGHKDPSKESREHAIWDEDGLLSITGGKLTTFRVMARQLLEKARRYLPAFQFDDEAAVFDDALPKWPDRLPPAVRLRLRGRYGPRAGEIAAQCPPDELAFIPGTETLWVEVRHALRHEMVVHLDDLMLRRVRLGQILPRGGADVLARVLAMCVQELGWSTAQMAEEEKNYLDLIAQCYSVPDHLVQKAPAHVAAEASRLVQEVP